jgi:hypothetical protein
MPPSTSSGVQLIGVAGVGAAQYGPGQVGAASPKTMQEQGGRTQSCDGPQAASPQASCPPSVGRAPSRGPPSRWSPPEVRLEGEQAGVAARVPRTPTTASIARTGRCYTEAVQPGKPCPWRAAREAPVVAVASQTLKRAPPTTDCHPARRRRRTNTAEGCLLNRILVPMHTSRCPNCTTDGDSVASPRGRAERSGECIYFNPAGSSCDMGSMRKG